MKKEYKSSLFKSYQPTSHPRHGSDARTTYIRLLMRGYIKERTLIEQIKQAIRDNENKVEKDLTNEYLEIVSDMKLCFKRLLSRQEHDNQEKYNRKDRRKDRIEAMTIKINDLIKDNKLLQNKLRQLKVKVKEKEVVYNNN